MLARTDSNNRQTRDRERNLIDLSSGRKSLGAGRSEPGLAHQGAEFEHSTTDPKRVADLNLSGIQRPGVMQNPRRTPFSVEKD